MLLYRWESWYSETLNDFGVTQLWVAVLRRGSRSPNFWDSVLTSIRTDRVGFASMIDSLRAPQTNGSLCNGAWDVCKCPTSICSSIWPTIFLDVSFHPILLCFSVLPQGILSLMALGTPWGRVDSIHLTSRASNDLVRACGLQWGPVKKEMVNSICLFSPI